MSCPDCHNRGGFRIPGGGWAPCYCHAFTAGRSPFTRKMAGGHYLRCGHELEGYYLPPVPDGIGEFIRTCCDN